MSGHIPLPADPLTCRCCRCATWWCFRTWSFRCLWAAQEHQGAGGRDGGRAPHHAGGAEGSRQGRARCVTDMFDVGCVSTILQMLKLPDGTVKVLVEGQQRAGVNRIDEGDCTSRPTSRRWSGGRQKSSEVEALRRAVMQQFDQYVKLNKKIPPEILTSISSIDDPGRLADTIAAHLPLKLDNKQIGAGPGRCEAAPGKPVRADRARSRHPERRQEDPWPRQAPDGKEPARLLPQ
jgi:hypothetical protein